MRNGEKTTRLTALGKKAEFILESPFLLANLVYEKVFSIHSILTHHIIFFVIERGRKGKRRFTLKIVLDMQ